MQKPERYARHRWSMWRPIWVQIGWWKWRKCKFSFRYSNKSSIEKLQFWQNWHYFDGKWPKDNYCISGASNLASVSGTIFFASVSVFIYEIRQISRIRILAYLYFSRIPKAKKSPWLPKSRLMRNVQNSLTF